MSNKVPTTKRYCLKCYEPFQSKGKHNRICPQCNKTNRSPAVVKTNFPKTGPQTKDTN